MRSATRSTAVLLTAGLVALVLLPGSSATAGAAGASADAPPNGFSLAISPTRLTVSAADIGSTQSIKVINGGTAPMPITVEKQNFTSDSQGTLVFQKEASYSASTWVTLSPTSFVVPPGGTTVVTATITVPARPEPGDHHLALVFLAPAGQTAANVRINRGIGMPVFVTVPGAFNDDVQITKLDADGFSLGGSVDVTASVHSSGTVHRDFRAPNPLKVDVGDRGHAEPFPDFTVMRGGTREVATTWDAPLMCICHVKVAVANEGGTVESKTVTVVVFPLVKVGLLLAALLVAVVAYRLARRRYRSNVIRAAVALRPEGA